MTDAPVARKLPEAGTPSSKDILLLAVWCGLVTGLVEGAAVVRELEERLRQTLSRTNAEPHPTARGSVK